MTERTGLFWLPMDEYHADKVLSVPTLSAGIADALINQTPLHAWAAHPRLGNLAESDHNDASDIGTICHALLFEGIDRMVKLEYNDWRTNAAKDAREAARADGWIAVLAKHAAPIQEAVAAARRAWELCDDLKGYTLVDGVAEHVMVWREGEQFARARPDWLSSDRRVIIDGKFTRGSASPEAFARQVVQMAYDLRAAFYARGVRALFEVECTYVFLVTEMAPPYVSICLALDPAYLDMGRAKAESAITLWSRCMKTNTWPGHLSRIHYVSPPGYALAQWQEREVQAVADFGLAGEA